jgi:hypothetical protein
MPTIRDQIIQATCNLLEKQGYPATGLNEIVKISSIAGKLSTPVNGVNLQIKSPRIRIPKCPLIQKQNVPWPPLAIF